MPERQPATPLNTVLPAAGDAKRRSANRSRLSTWSRCGIVCSWIATPALTFRHSRRAQRPPQRGPRFPPSRLMQHLPGHAGVRVYLGVRAGVTQALTQAEVESAKRADRAKESKYLSKPSQRSGVGCYGSAAVRQPEPLQHTAETQCLLAEAFCGSRALAPPGQRFAGSFARVD